MRLIAVYDLTLDAPLFFANPITHLHEYDLAKLPAPMPADLFGFSGEPTIKATIGEFDCIATFLLGDAVNPLQRKHTMPAADRMKVSLAAETPSVDFSIGDQFVPVMTRYLHAMWDIVHKLMDYFKYERGFPFLRPLNAQNIAAVTWTDDEGNTIHEESMTACFLGEFPGLPGTPGSHVGLGARPIRPSEVHLIEEALKEPRTYEVDEQLRSQARDAIYVGDYRLATIQLAIACEVKIKRSFFGTDSVSSDTFDWLGDRQKVTVSAMDLIGDGAKQIFGESFKAVSPKQFQALENVFRCRNKVAHRGTTMYRDSTGIMMIANRDTLNDWWLAVEAVFQWLDRKRTAT